LFFFQETYNTQLQERHKEDHLTFLELNLDLWLEVGLFGGPNKNKIYGISNTTTEDVRMSRNV